MPEDKEKIIAPDAGSTETQHGFGQEIKPTPEKAPLEATELLSAGRLSEQEEKQSAKETLQPAVAPFTLASPQEFRYKKIESILEEDLNDIYRSLDPHTQMQFRAKGEETAKGIFQLLSQAKVKVKKIINLIRNWLKLIPGINKYFLEQEIKIKTDKILTLVDKNNQQIK